MRKKSNTKGHVKQFILAASAVVAAGIIGTVAATVYADDSSTDQNVIADNIYIGSISVGGMTEEEATEAVNAYADTLQDTTFTLEVNDKKISATARDLGISWSNTDVVTEARNIGKTGNIIERYKAKKDLEHEKKVLDITYTADKNQVESFLESHEKEINQDAVNYGLTRENGSFQITEGKEGIKLNIKDSTAAVVSYVEKKWNAAAASVTLVADVVKPEGTREELEKVQDILGTYTTDFSSSNAGRAQNVKNGASKINGTVIYPGEEFSVYNKVSPFSAENGYELAGSYENGTTVETYGGGICQVSTTLYNAVIRAELEVEERYNHSMVVAYVQPSMDAAIAGTYKDMKFKNNQDTPIYIESYTSGGQLTFNIYGEETRDSSRSISFESETVSTQEPTVEYQASADYPIGYFSVTQNAHQGITARLWKIITVDGKEKSREVFNNSTYKASPKIITVGVASDSSEATAAMTTAIASQDEATIQAAAASNSASAIAAKNQEQTETAGDDGAEKTTESATSADQEDAAKSDSKKTDNSKKSTSKTQTVTNKKNQ